MSLASIGYACLEKGGRRKTEPRGLRAGQVTTGYPTKQDAMLSSEQHTLSRGGIAA